jgi:hypothetical protein
MIVQDHVLYSRVLTPYGRIVKEPTVLGVVLLGAAFSVGIAAIVFLFSFL